MQETTSQLLQATHAVSQSINSQEKLLALKSAFETFSLETSRLENAYSHLKDEFRSVNTQLQNTVSTLNEKVQELDLTSRYLNSILTHMTQGIIVIAPSGIVTTYNPAAEKILQVAAPKILFQSFWQEFDDHLFGFSLKEALQEPRAVATSLIHYQGLVLEVTVNFVAGPQESTSSLQNILLLIKDMTEMHRLQKMASLNDRMKELGEMAASVAHEIRNPLGGIKGFAALLKRDLCNQPHLKKMAEYIVDGADSLNRLVTNVLNYSRPLQVQLELKNLTEEMKVALDIIQLDAPLSEGVSFHFEASADALILPLDAHLFRSALLNLLINAVQSMDKKGQVFVRIDQIKDEVAISIQDEGCGISEENLEKIFSPFFTTKTKGNGFGLPQVHKIIQAHGGTIEVSSFERKGTSFTIKLPLKY
ncbi:MAG: putative two-component sensor histidine kinase [Chlamydiales bacterium]|jgi:signal transduction histidine kinase|nr:putative two-component sensor histidine kinase [Chlamydiales bacterium]